MKRLLGVSILCALLLSSSAYPEESSDLHRGRIKGASSWYSQESPGIKEFTASMEPFEDQDLTCAMWGVPFNTLIKVTNLSNGKSVIVRVNDRGPARRLVKQGRIIDLTKAAFSRIAELEKGLIPIELCKLEPAGFCDESLLRQSHK